MVKKTPIPLETIEKNVQQCRLCPLWETRTHTVFGAGDPHARVLIVGEAPGRTEDEQGLPFVGAAGHLLDEMLGHAHLTRDEVFIANVLKCRPPNNRNPLADEIEACVPYLREQTRTINPEFIVTLGNFATQFILKTGVGIMRLHGQLQRAGRFYVLPMFHPAFVLRNASQRQALEYDWEYLGKLLEQSAAHAARMAEQPTGAEAQAQEQQPDRQASDTKDSATDLPTTEQLHF